MMNPPPIIIISSYSSSESPVPLETGIRSRRSFCVRQLRKNSKGAAPPSLLPPQGQNTQETTSNVRRSRSASPSSGRRKRGTSPHALKRKYLRQVKLLPLPQFHLSKGRKSVSNEASEDTTPSTFEEELADQENQSPNDPEFVRRASERWRRRTGVVNLQQPFQLSKTINGSLLSTFQTSPVYSHQADYQRHIAMRVIHYPQSPFNTASPSPIIKDSPFRRRSLQHSSLNTSTTKSNFRRNSRSYSSFGSFSRSRSYLKPDDRSRSRSGGLGRLLRSAARSVSPSNRSKCEGKTKPRRSLDDIAAEEIKRKVKKEQLLLSPEGSSSSPTSRFRRLSNKIRKSFRGSKDSRKKSNDNKDIIDNTNASNYISYKTDATSTYSLSSTSSRYSNDSGVHPMDSASFTSSTSYQSFLSSSSGYASDYSSCPSSPIIDSRRVSISSMSHPGGPLNSLQTGPLSFQDIFLDEPQIAEKLTSP